MSNSYYENLFPKIETEQPIKKYYAYKNGVSKEFDNIDKAKEFSKLVETLVNEQRIKDQKTLSRDRNTKIYHAWLTALKEENKEIFELNLFDDCADFYYDEYNFFKNRIEKNKMLIL